jgi:hypothetical protein
MKVSAMRPIFAIGTLSAVGASAIVGQAYSQSVDRAFEALPACQKLDAIAADRKDVAEYIANSGFDEFATDVLEECPRYLVDLGGAWEMMANNPNLNMFERLSPCAQLNAIESDGKSLSAFIVDSGYDRYARPVLNDCPRHLEELGTAWKALNPEPPIGGLRTSNPPQTFAELSRCDQLDVIEATPSKSVIDHIYGSGIEDYEYAVRSQCNRHLPALQEAEKRTNADSRQPVATTLDVAIAPARNALNPEFERLSPCQKLKVIQGSGKSLPQYIADSGVEDFKADIYRMCPRYEASLIAAERMLANPN